MKKGKNAGFTLIELFLALAIMSLMFAMLQPGVHRARDKTNSVVCASNLKQLFQATLTYCQDWNEYLPRSIGMLEPYVEETQLAQFREEKPDILALAFAPRNAYAGGEEEGGGKGGKGEEKKGGAPTPDEIADTTEQAKDFGVLSPYYRYMYEITQCPLIEGYMFDDPPIYSYGVNVLTAGTNLRDFYRDTIELQYPAFSKMPLYGDSDYVAISAVDEMAFRHDRGELSKIQPIEGRCIVAYMDGHLGWVFEEEAQEWNELFGGGGEDEGEETPTPTPTPTETPGGGW